MLLERAPLDGLPLALGRRLGRHAAQRLVELLRRVPALLGQGEPPRVALGARLRLRHRRRAVRRRRERLHLLCQAANLGAQRGALLVRRRRRRRRRLRLRRVRAQCREAPPLGAAQRRLRLAQAHGEQCRLELAAPLEPARLGLRGVGAAVGGELALSRVLTARAQPGLLGARLLGATTPLARRAHLLVERDGRRLESQQQRGARARIRRALARIRLRRRAHRRRVLARRRRRLAARRGELLEGGEVRRDRREVRRDLARHARLEGPGQIGEQLRLHAVPRHRLLQRRACGRVVHGLLVQLRELLVALARRRELVLLEHEVRLLPLHLPGLLLVRAAQRLEGGTQLGGGVALRVEPLLQQRDRRVLLVAQRALQHAPG